MLTYLEKAGHNMELILRQIAIVFLLLYLTGCGSGEDEPFVNVPTQSPQGTLLEGFVANHSLQGLYNSITVSYSPVARTATPVPRVHNGDILFPVGAHGGGFAAANPTFFTNNPMRAMNYDFPIGNTGLGSMSIETTANSGVSVVAPYATEPGGGLAVFSLDSTMATSPTLGVMLKAVPSGQRSLSSSNFTGRWGYVSMNSVGSVVAAELDFVRGNVSGLGFHNNPTGPVSGSSMATLNSTYSINPNGDKLLFMDSTWFVNTDTSIAMTGEATSVGSDRLSLLFRPLRSTDIVDGQFEVFQWLVRSNNSSLGTTGDPAPAVVAAHEVISTGTIQFSSGSATLSNILSVNNSESYQLQPGSDSIWSFPSLENNLDDTVRLRILFSADRKFLFGVDYANDRDERTALLVGVRRSSPRTI